jgi:gliding motility-associated-like protein
MLVNASYGNQVLIVQDSEGCTDTVHYVIDYVPCCDIYMPNAFSPNNDGHNDLFRIIDFGVITLKSFEIFDRWGHKVFSTNSIDGAWDGKFQDSDYEIGTYYYLIRYACLLSTELIIKKGDFTLLR